MAWRRFLETTAIAAYLFSAFGLNPVTWLVMGYLAVSTTFGLNFVLLYVLWIYIDRNTSETGGRRYLSIGEVFFSCTGC